MVQDRRNLERMYAQRERDYQRSEMRQAEARARYAEYERDNRLSQRRSAAAGGQVPNGALRPRRARVRRCGPSTNGQASSQSGILGSLVLGLLLAAVGAAAWWSFKLLRWGLGHLLRLVGWGGVATLAAIALAGGYALAHFLS